MEDDDIALVVRRLFEENPSLAEAITGAYGLLIGGVPNLGGYEFLMKTALATNFGAGEGPVFNEENIYINIFNNLVSGNLPAVLAFNELTGEASSLGDQIATLYAAIVPQESQTANGLAFMTRPDALEFYRGIATERGLEGDLGAAIVAMAGLVDILTDAGIGIGDEINIFMQAIADGTANLPDQGEAFTPLTQTISPSEPSPDATPAGSGGGGGGDSGGSGGGSPTNATPTAVALQNGLDLAKNADTSSSIKVADILMTDDGLGTNIFGLTGADADKFTIVGTELFLKANVALDHESDPDLEVAVMVDDVAV